METVEFENNKQGVSALRIVAVFYILPRVAKSDFFKIPLKNIIGITLRGNLLNYCFFDGEIKPAC